MGLKEDQAGWKESLGGTVEIRDYSLWIKHISGNALLSASLEALPAGATVQLEVDGHRGVWQKKESGTHGLPTQGLKPLGEMRPLWFLWFKERRGQRVGIKLISSEKTLQRAPAKARIALEPAAPEPERRAAWAALEADMKAGWRSEGPYGSRDELHER